MSRNSSRPGHQHMRGLCVVGHGSDDYLDVLVELLSRPGLLSREFGDVKIMDEIVNRCNAIPRLATWRSVGLMLVHG